MLRFSLCLVPVVTLLAGGGQPPEFLSTHPSHGRRIADLQAALPRANRLRAAARQRGLRPRCY
jgi:predicted Zn-dependent protease